MDNVIKKIKTLTLDDNIIDNDGISINYNSANISLQDSKPSPKNNFYNYKFSYSELKIIESLINEVIPDDNRYKPSIKGELLYSWLGMYNNSFYIFTNYGGIVEVKIFLYDDYIKTYPYIEFRQTIKGTLELPVSYDIDGIYLFGINSYSEEETKRLISINEHSVRNLKYCIDDVMKLEKKKFNELKSLYDDLFDKYENVISKKNNLIDITYKDNTVLTRQKKKDIDLINEYIGKISSIIDLLNNTIKGLNKMDTTDAINSIYKSLNDTVVIINDSIK